MVANVWLCPGQGSQFVGMGKDLAAQFPAARETFEAIDSALGVPLSRLMFEGPEAELTQTQNAQPAILAHSAAVFAVVKHKVENVVAAAGHSLGEYSAYVCAGALTAPEAAKLVRRRGELMAKAAQDRDGTMTAIIGLPTADVEACCKTASSAGNVAVAANLNTSDQTVISGDVEAVTKAGDACKAKGARRVIPLNVSGAFHSPLMAPATDKLALALNRAPFTEPKFPVFANATAEPVKDADRGRRLLVDQVTLPVRWVACMQGAAKLAGAESRYIEIGPGQVLAGLAKRILPAGVVLSLGTASEVAKFLETG